MSSILEKVTGDNWRTLAPEVAQEVFSEGTLVTWTDYGIREFGLVDLIGKTGKIVVQKGELPLEKVTDSNGATYCVLWYSTDLDKFKPVNKIRFSPYQFLGDDWAERNLNTPIGWRRGRNYLYLPNFSEDNLIRHSSYCD